MKTVTPCNRIVLALTIALLATVALQSSAATHYVSQTSPTPTPPYSSTETAAHNIQDAVDVATDGDTVLVEPGDYGVTNQITVTNAVRLQSTDGAGQTFLTGHGSIWCLAISNALAAADGFTLRPGTESSFDPGGAVLVGGTIQNCNFTNFDNVRGSIAMSGGTVSNVIVAYVRAPSCSSCAAVSCSDSGLITDSRILGTAGNASGEAVALVNSRLQNSVISGWPNPGNISGPAVSAISSTVVSCTISNNYARGRGGGAYLQDSLMDRCIVTGNTAGSLSLGTGGGGVFETNSVIRDSLIVGNQAVMGDGGATYAGLGGGVYMQGGALLNCTVAGNFAHEPPALPGGGGGVFAESGGITNCIIYLNSLDLDRPSTNWYNMGPAIFDHCCTTPDPGGTGNVIADPQFVNAANGNYRLVATSPCIDAGRNQPWMTGAQDLDGYPRIRGTTVDIGAYENPSPAGTHYVSQTSPNPTPPYSTPQTAAHTIQDAVDVANDGDIVLVEPGDYGVTNQITVTNAVRLQSTDGAGQTFLTGHGSIWCLAISNALAAVDGFTLRPGTESSFDPGGAVLVGGTIQNCNFTNFDNVRGSIAMSGGAVSNVIVAYIRGPAGDAVSCSDSGLITDSRILGTAGNANGTAVALVNSRLQNSVVSGGPNGGNSKGAAVSAISSTVVSCTISNNYSKGKGGGVYLQDSLMDRCIVTGNTDGTLGLGFGGGGGIFETNSVIRNSLIFGNQAVLGDGDASSGGLGGGIYMQGGALLNCTVSGNSASETPTLPGAGGGVYAESGGITNCIIYFNSLGLNHPSTNWYNAGPAIFDHCCTAPDPGGAGNVIADPQFVNAANGNFHLASTSPCIDAGIVQPWMTGAQDLDGNPRVTGASADIGAYESAAPPILSITRSGGNIILRWPSAGTAGLVLQQSADLTAPASWTPSGATITDDGIHKSATVPASNSVQFFRLR